MSLKGARNYDRIPAELLIALSLSPISVRQAHIRAIAFIAALLIATVCAYLIHGQFTPITFSFSIVIAVGVGVFTPWRRSLAQTAQSILDRHRRVPISIQVPIDKRWIRADQIEAGQWVCRQRDHKDDTREHRDRHGRSAMEPDANYRLATAFSRYSGHQMRVAFGDGSAEFWNPQAYVSVLDGPSSQTSDLAASSAEAFDTLLSSIAEQGDQSIEYSRIPWYLSARAASFHDRELALRAAVKWRLIREQGDVRRGSYQLTEAGEEWVEATEGGYDRNVRRRTLRRSGASVTNNFYGPSNYIQGTNHGTMNANRFGSATPEELLEAIREVLRSDIPWDRPELANVREGMANAVAKQDPSWARGAIRKLGTVVETLALGVSSNHAYQLLVSHFS